jgi:hypothetical protein
MKRKMPLNMMGSLLLLICVFAAGRFGLASAKEARAEEATRILEDSLRRAAVCCYAIEGRYPDTLDYIVDHYGVYVDDAAFAVFYEAFATNIIPDITVIER